MNTEDLNKKYREEFIEFANFTKNCQYSKKTEDAWKQWIDKKNKENIMSQKSSLYKEIFNIVQKLTNDHNSDYHTITTELEHLFIKKFINNNNTTEEFFQIRTPWGPDVAKKMFTPIEENDNNKITPENNNNISLRDYFAGIAMQIIYNQAWDNLKNNVTSEMPSHIEIAGDAYYLADNMVEINRRRK